MHLLVGINNNIPEWKESLFPTTDRPRLPLPYAFGAAFVNRGHTLSALNATDNIPQESNIFPFQRIYRSGMCREAIKNVDLVALWGGVGATTVAKQCLSVPGLQNVILCTYVWQLSQLRTLSSIKLGWTSRIAAHFARAVVVMTEEQAQMARQNLSISKVPVIKFGCGIDTEFYKVPSNISDVPEAHRKTVEKLHNRPFVIMPGDQLRLNQVALDLVKKSDLCLVRISQYLSEDERAALRCEIKKRKIEKQFIVFEKVDHPFLRFLLQHAAAYVGLVDSTWQPAGWTVACEALASGLSIVIFEGLVSRELENLGCDKTSMHCVPMNDSSAFQKAIQFILGRKDASQNASAAMRFAAQSLDFKRTSMEFINKIEALHRGDPH